MKEQIVLKDVEFKYLNSVVFAGINLKINKGDYIIITGGNGSGKSTLLKLILGLIKPSKGLVKTESRKIISANVGYVSQSNNIDKEFPITVEELIHLECNVSSKTCSLSPEIHLAKFNAEHLINKKIAELSGGELQKVLICRAFVTEPEILILDEPTNNLDKIARQNLYKLLMDLNNQGKTIINVTHAHDEHGYSFKNAISYDLVNGKLVEEVHND
ncbi:MAG: ATP-binding cassette domain-containing protein [bacterium]|nr:ATP-binding cassette domain-containing protein [bacterium]